MSTHKQISADLPSKKSQKTAGKTPLPTTQKGTIPIRFLEDPRAHRAPWELTLHVDGKRQRKAFATEAEAVKAWTAHKRLVKSFGTLPYRFDPTAQIEYDHARRQLPPGTSLDEAVAFFVMNSRRSDAPTLRAAINQFIQVKTVTLERSALHVKDLRLRLEKLAKSFGEERRIDTLTRNDLLDLLLGLGKAPRTLRNFERGWHNFFRYYQRRGVITVNPLDGIDRNDMPAVKEKPKVLLTVDQARGFMRTIATKHPTLIRWAAVQLFAGVRDAEAERLHASMCDETRKIITIPADICKTADSHVMHGLPDVLWTWFARQPLDQAPFPYPSNRLWTTIRAELAELPDPAERVAAWPFNALRRSFCTYGLSFYGSANQVAIWLRHTSPNRLYKSYAGALVAKDVSETFFNLTPDVCVPRS